MNGKFQVVVILYLHIYNTHKHAYMYIHIYDTYGQHMDTHIFIYYKCFGGFSQSEFFKKMFGLKGSSL